MRSRGYFLLEYILAIMFFTLLLVSINRNLTILLKLQKSLIKDQVEIYGLLNGVIKKVRSRDLNEKDNNKYDIYIERKKVIFFDEGQEILLVCNDKGMYANNKKIIKDVNCGFNLYGDVLEIRVEKEEVLIIRRIKL
ncbi:hypothetical protein HP397_05650 [Streptobacillus felis]|uniref:Uncharacterized protein n=1 Tax=Streptobacillus felis TaxID=1384509 RepID=A0A7Z0PHV9_9FUSO|nr:hypothetical protein [Streptobacillus felis]NYV28285.1 hypothetical protein [Streptobacillus felis]